MTTTKPTSAFTHDIQEQLLLTKAQHPPTAEQVKDLQRISHLDVSAYSEMDVRAEVIDPVLRILGYAKETRFSLHRDKSLRVLGATMTPDYRVTLFEQDFWVIEAKKVHREKLRFTDKELRQALEYAAHPEINAALVVLCNGRLFEVYDREHSVETPIARVEVQKLAEDFHVLQALLAPWQAWFFQKRRVLRLMNRVLVHEVQPGRLSEFRKTINQRLDSLQGIALRNWQKSHSLNVDQRQREADLRAMTARDVIEAEFFRQAISHGDLTLITQLVAEKAPQGGFEVLHTMFPDHPRLMNDGFLGAALLALIKLEEGKLDATWLPSWLGGGRGPEGLSEAIKMLIGLGLDSFNGNPDRKLVLQYAACARRLAKINAALLSGMMQVGERRHELLRWMTDELHSSQYFSTPARHTLQFVNELQLSLTANFLSQCRIDNKEFDRSRANLQLKEAWRLESLMLKDGSDYWSAVRALGLAEMFMESAWISYDYLGHLVLCILKMSPERWQRHAMEVHLDSIKRLAAYGSHQAAEFLKLPTSGSLPGTSEEELAERFFGGDLKLFEQLRRAYSDRSET
jgi:hypothetical protein